MTMLSIHILQELGCYHQYVSLINYNTLIHGLSRKPRGCSIDRKPYHPAYLRLNELQLMKFRIVYHIEVSVEFVSTFCLI
jgi:hypothetical protein